MYVIKICNVKHYIGGSGTVVTGYERNKERLKPKLCHFRTQCVCC